MQARRLGQGAGQRFSACRPVLRAGQRSSVLVRADGLRSSVSPAKEKVLQLISSPGDNDAQLGPAIEELLPTCPIPRDQLAAKSFLLGQGTWQVVHAPHIARMSSLLGTKFDIQYRLEGDKLASHVKYSGTLGTGWLSASGSMARKYDDSVEVLFDTFWVDGPDGLRLQVPASESSLDTVVSLLGRSAFFPQMAVFPVHYLDEDLCVFEFPALSSKICVKRSAP